MWGDLVLYVGKTIRKLNCRANMHRSRINNTHSRYIPDYMDWGIKLLEECSDEQAIKREQYWYDTLMPFYNNKRPGQTKPEYDKIYKESHREEINARERQYYTAKKAASKQ